VSKIKIINVGGTFNKKYSLLDGSLMVPNDNKVVENILSNVYKSNTKPKVEGIIFKDSLDMKSKDRKILLEKVSSLDEDKIVIIHGTDTMDKSAKYLAKRIKYKQIVFVGAMQPFSIEPVEATGTLMMAIGFLQSNKKEGIYICMNGLLQEYTKIKKNYEKGVFEWH
jgi:L-asparaginase